MYIYASFYVHKCMYIHMLTICRIRLSMRFSDGDACEWLHRVAVCSFPSTTAEQHRRCALGAIWGSSCLRFPPFGAHMSHKTRQRETHITPNCSHGLPSVLIRCCARKPMHRPTMSPFALIITYGSHGCMCMGKSCGTCVQCPTRETTPVTYPFVSHICTPYIYIYINLYMYMYGCIYMPLSMYINVFISIC